MTEHARGVAATPANDPADDLDPGLDPESWDEFRTLGHEVLDAVVDHLQGVRGRPPWREVPEEVRLRLQEAVPRNGVGARAALERALSDVLAYPVGNTHPRFYGWVIGSGTPVGVLAELVAAAMNPNVSGLRSGAIPVEDQVLAWLAELMGFPADTGGLLVSGGSMANVLGLAVGLDARAGFDVKNEGLVGAPSRPVLYVSQETHYSVDKGVRMLGLGLGALRKIPVDSEYRIDLAALEAAIAADRRAGLHPFLVVGNAGTVNTGAFDDLAALADLARRDGLWFHVDGAFGAFAALVPALRDRVRGLERADSVAFDLHKWLHVPIEAGCLLVRDPEAQRRAFALGTSYLVPLERGVGRDGMRFADRGPQLTRGFRALKVWASLSAHGADAHARAIERNVEQARYLAGRIDATPGLERLAPVPLNVVCFRATPAGVAPERLDGLNRELLMRLQETGAGVPSHTVLDGHFALRACLCNHRTRREDLDALVDGAVEIAGALVREDGAW